MNRDVGRVALDPAVVWLIDDVKYGPGKQINLRAILVLHHAADPGRILAAVRRTLKPGGRLLVVDMQPHDHLDYREQMGHQWLGFEESALRGWLEEAGFGAARFVALPSESSARGPALFAATAAVPVAHSPLTADAVQTSHPIGARIP